MDTSRGHVYMGPPMSTAPIPTRAVSDRSELRRALMRDPIGTAYQLGVLEAAYAPACHWFAGGEEECVDGLVLVYTGLSIPVVISWGAPSAVRRVFDDFEGEFPGRALIQMQADHLEAVDRRFATDNLHPILRMGLRAGDLMPAREDEFDVVRLTMRQIGELFALFTFYPDNHFEPAQLATGHYYGIWSKGDLVSVAGVHFCSPRNRVACLGNIVTRPDHRGLGLSTACTSRLCRELIGDDIQILGLNVIRANRYAVRVYEKLGFRDHATYLEGMVVMHALQGR